MPRRNGSRGALKQGPALNPVCEVVNMQHGIRARRGS